MSQLDPSRYRKLSTSSPVYGVSYGLYWDETLLQLCLAVNDAVVARCDATGITADFEFSGEARGDILRRGASAWERHVAKTAAQVLAGDGTDVKSHPVTQDVSLTSNAGNLVATVVNLTQLNQATGDLIYRNAAATFTRLAKGAAGAVLQQNAATTAPQWAPISGDASIADGGALTVTDVTVGGDTKGDILYKSSATALARKAIGTAGRRLVVSAADTVPTWDNGKIVKASLTGLTTADDPWNIQADGSAADGSTGVFNISYLPDGTRLAYFPLGAGQTLHPVAVADGIDIGCDQADNEGLEIAYGFPGCDGRPFSVGVDAAFYMLVKLQIQTINGCDDLFVGFRKAELVNADAEAYDTYFGLGLNTAATPGALKVRDELNGGGVTNTDTTQTIASATDLQIKVMVSAAGVATVQHDAAVPGTLAAPTATHALTFDDGDQLIPYVRFLHANAAQAGSVIIKSFEVGYQA